MNEEDKKTLENYGFKQEYKNEYYCIYTVNREKYTAKITIYDVKNTLCAEKKMYRVDIFIDSKFRKKQWSIEDFLKFSLNYIARITRRKIGKKKREVVDLEYVDKIFNMWTVGKLKSHFMNTLRDRAFQIEE